MSVKLNPVLQATAELEKAARARELAKEYAGKRLGGSLGLAAFSDNIDEVVTHLASGVSPNAKDSDGLTPLHRASVKGHLRIVQLLLAKGCDVHATDAYGDTPLFYASSCGHVAVVRALLEAGADPYTRAKDGSTPLDVAQKERHSDVVSLIREMVPHGAPPAAAAGAAVGGGEEGPRGRGVPPTGKGVGCMGSCFRRRPKAPLRAA